MAGTNSSTQFGVTASSVFDGYDISGILKERTKVISESVSGFTNQTVNPIKSTIADLKSGIALIKDTDQKLMNQLFSYKSSVIETINDYMGSLTGGKISLADFGSVISYRDGFKVDSDALVRMAGKTLGFNIGSISSIGNDLSREFLNELNSMTLGLSNGLFQVDGGRVTIAGDWDRNIGNSVFDFLSSGSSSFRTVNNFAASNAILNTMVRQNATIGFVEGYGAFKDMYLYESDYHDALVSNIPLLLQRGDVNSLKEILNIISETSLYTVKSRYDNFSELVLSNFNLPEGTLPENYDDYKNTLLEIIKKVNGENWNKSYTFMGWVLNMAMVTNISEDSKTVLMREDSLVPFLCTANMFNKESALDTFKADFPDTVFL